MKVQDEINAKIEKSWKLEKIPHRKSLILYKNNIDM